MINASRQTRIVKQAGAMDVVSAVGSKMADAFYENPEATGALAGGLGGGLIGYLLSKDKWRGMLIGGGTGALAGIGLGGSIGALGESGKLPREEESRIEEQKRVLADKLKAAETVRNAERTSRNAAIVKGLEEKVLPGDPVKEAEKLAENLRNFRTYGSGLSMEDKAYLVAMSDAVKTGKLGTGLASAQLARKFPKDFGAPQEQFSIWRSLIGKPQETISTEYAPAYVTAAAAAKPSDKQLAVAQRAKARAAKVKEIKEKNDTAITRAKENIEQLAPATPSVEMSPNDFDKVKGRLSPQKRVVLDRYADSLKYNSNLTPEVRQQLLERMARKLSMVKDG